MPNRFQRNSIGELVCRVPLNRGSLLKSLENLVKTIETSENAVMIPTLLRDKVRVDAWELLFVAKILKASILGHDDLVEFYMNHIHQNSLSATMGAAAAGLVGEPALSPSLARQQSSPTMSSPKMTSLTTNGSNNLQATSTLASPLKDSQDNNTATTTNNHHSSTSLSTSSNHSSQSTASSSTATTGATSIATTTGAYNQTGQTNKSSSASWVTAQQSSGASLTSGSPFNSPACSSSSSTASSVHTAPPNVPTNGAEPVPVPVPVPNPNTAVAATIETNSSTTTTTNNNNNSEQPQIASLATPLKLAPEEPMQEGLLAARPLMARLAQPPSLLQLTTTNNHINSVSEMLNSSPLDPSLDLLSQHLISLQQQQMVAQANGFEPPAGSNLSLSISTNGQTINGGLSEQTAPSSLQHLLPSSAVSTPNQSQPPAPPTAARHELRSSRSAGCLFRANSGASSPRTPGTPYPQAETLAGSANQNGLVGEPTSLVKLLLQVEQLKASIVHVNTLLESVVELYKKSIDNISQ